MKIESFIFLINFVIWSDAFCTRRAIFKSYPSKNGLSHVENKKSKRFSKNTSSEDGNRILSPSTDPKSFDSGQIGRPVVHRYIRNNEESEYIMWYHGRGKNFDTTDSLPPLSTGRIGMAYSKNGLFWEKSLVGSESEDMSDVTLGLNKESWWGFDTAHVGLGQVTLPMSTPAVMMEGGVYLMYYMGGSYEETPIANFKESVPVGMEDVKIQGMSMKIGVALSQDGKSWGRVEGDDPTGAIMVPYDASDPLRNEKDENINLKDELYCGWPEVVVDDDSTKSSFIMYYSTMLKEDKTKVLAYAISDDGFKWLKRGVCIKPNSEGPDDGGCARCSVIKKAKYSKGTWENAKGWIMFYEGLSKKDGKHRILAAESDDLRSWVKLGIALDLGNETLNAWDCAGVGSPHVIRLDDGNSRMYYTGQNSDGSTAFGVAKCSSSGNDIDWEREQVTFSME